MKLNKIYVEPKTTALDDDKAPFIVEAKCFLRFVQENGKYFKIPLPAISSMIDSVQNLSSNERELAKAACDYVQTLPENSDIKELHFFCGHKRADVRENPASKQPEIVGTTEEPGFAAVAIKWKNHKQVTQIKPDDENMEQLHPEAKGFCDVVFNFKPNANGVGLYKRLYEIKHQKQQLRQQPPGKAIANDVISFKPDGEQP